MIISKIPNIEKIKSYFIKFGLKILVDNFNSKEREKTEKRFFKKTYGPNIYDLYRLHKLIIENKRTRILEYGTGWSTLVITHALQINKKRYDQKPFPRLKKPFSLTVIDNSKKYLKISEQRIKKFFKEKNIVEFNFSNNNVCLFNGRIASQYTNHPRINPDFIYLDGPDQFDIKGDINNLTIADYEFMPMSCDILRYENFLTPGTIILVDGRGANSIFLKNNFQRKWKYKYDFKNDQTLFYLYENPLGPLNKKQLEFYKKRK